MLAMAFSMCMIAFMQQHQTAPERTTLDNNESNRTVGRILSMTEAAEYLSISYDEVRKLVKLGKLKLVEDLRFKIARDECDRWANEQVAA